MRQILKDIKAPDPTLIITGDFNFPFVKWERNINGGCNWVEKKDVGAPREVKLQFDILNRIMDNFGLVQMIEEPTREKNTLDLVYTNESSLFSDIEVSKSSMSDHNFIELNTNMKTHINSTIKSKCNSSENSLYNLNFTSDRIEWENIKKDLEYIDWKDLFKEKACDVCLKLFIGKIIELCNKYIPTRKGNNTHSKIPKYRKRLFNKIKMLRRSKRKANNRRKEIIDQKIMEIEKTILENKRDERYLREKKIIENIKEKPKMFYGLIKSNEKRINKIGPFRIDGEYITENNNICKTMMNQYNGRFSKKDKPNKDIDEKFENIKDDDISDIDFNEKDIERAIGVMNKSSAAGPDGIPAILFIETKLQISVPLTIILRKSIDEGNIPDMLKLAYITPIHKGGSKLKPENYRPVSLTSQVMKIFERVVKARIMGHLENNKMINPGQHGFVRGRSTQTQLLDHLCRVYEALIVDARLDTVSRFRESVRQS